jgi:predicted nucleic acid-binding protein
MIYLDTNVFIRYFAQPDSPRTEAMHAIASALFDAAERGDLDVTTSEVVLHEVAWVLGAKQPFHLPASEIAPFLAPLLQMPAMKLPRGDKRLFLRALDIYVAHPTLGYGDSIIAARAERLGASLATFDEALGKLDIVDRWEPPRLPND